MDHYNPPQTPAEIEFDAAARLALIRYAGSVSAEGLSAAHEALFTLLNGRPVAALIMDVRASTPAYSPAELIESVETCLADLPLERCAVVAPATGRERLMMLLETIAFGHGVRVRAFGEPDQAKQFALGV